MDEKDIQVFVDTAMGLASECHRLQEENESLWWMLDELKKSQTWTKEQIDELQKSIDEQILSLKLMQMRKGEA